MKNDLETKRSGSDYVERSPNGPDLLTVCLAAAIRFFAGGESYDITCMFGVSHTVVFESIGMVVNAISKCEETQIPFSTSRARQRENARGFCSKLEVGFENVVECIDGIVIWTRRPTKEDCKDVDVDKSIFCGRKNKFGLNLKTICNYKPAGWLPPPSADVLA